MPRLGETMEEGIVVAWLVEPGTHYKRGQLIAEIETDKTIVELPALADGQLVEILAPAGSTVAVGAPLATVLTQAKQDKDVDTAHQEDSQPSRPPVATHSTPTAEPQITNGTDKLLASPNARRVARELGVELSAVQPTGRRGRRTAADVAAVGQRPQLRSQTTDAIIDKATGLAIYHWPSKHPDGRPPLLLIHGLFGNSAAWAGVATNLSNTGIEVYALDLPGHGNSNSELVKINDIVAAVQKTVRSRTDKPLRLAGISLGAVVAAELALLDDACDSLRLVCPAGLGPRSNAAFINAMLAAAQGTDGITAALTHLGDHGAKLGTKAIDRMVRELTANVDQLTKMATLWFPQGQQTLDIIPTLNKLKIPTSVLFALEDQIFPWQDAANLPVHVPGHFLAGAGHMAHMDAHDQVVAFLANFG